MNTDDMSAIARIRVRKSPSDVFTAFSDASEMSRFWFTRRDENLIEGRVSTWFIGGGENAISFDVRVKEIDNAKKIVIEWPGHDGEYTQVKWSFEETGDGDTILTIEETGFTGSSDAIVERVIDSTGGFNQVIVAAKALVEHRVELNVVSDHA
jgi:uncharacterized protein YndB with AHSA1/START domain